MFGLFALCVVVFSGTACTREAPTTATRSTDGVELHFAGDVYFGEAYNSALSDASPAERYEAPMTGVAPVLSTGPVVANLETALTDARESELDGSKRYLHWSRPADASAALARFGFVGLSLANNHTMDYGVAGLAETRAALVSRGLTPFGAGSTLSEARKPYQVELSLDDQPVSVAIFGAYWFRERYGKRYKFYADGRRGGVRSLGLADLSAQIRESKREAPDRMVVVFPHWGQNYTWRSRTQRRLARALIDAGADLVIGHGAHVYQEVERYRGRWIVYGLGNLVFLSPGRYRDHDVPAYSMLATLRWTRAASAMQPELRLRFIASDNLDTGYRPEMLVGDTFDEARATLEARSCRHRDTFCRVARMDVDDFGPYVRLPLGK